MWLMKNVNDNAFNIQQHIEMHIYTHHAELIKETVSTAQHSAHTAKQPLHTKKNTEEL